LERVVSDDAVYRFGLRLGDFNDITTSCGEAPTRNNQPSSHGARSEARAFRPPAAPPFVSTRSVLMIVRLYCPCHNQSSSSLGWNRPRCHRGLFIRIFLPPPASSCPFNWFLCFFLHMPMN
jgi:hypothetical protein